MEQTPQWYELAKRVHNFYGSQQIELDKIEKNGVAVDFLSDLYDIFLGLNNNQSFVSSNNEVKLKCIFETVVNLILIKDFSSHLLYRQMYNLDAVNDLLAACFFTTLSMFLHHTKRLPGSSLMQFIYDYTPYTYNDKNSNSYFDLRKEETAHGYNRIKGAGQEQCKNDATTFRKQRNRILSQREVQIKRGEWHSMPDDSNHEWSFRFALEKNSDSTWAETWKRLGNLNNEIQEVLNSKRDDTYDERVRSAYRKFSSKLSKLEYSGFLDLQKEILSHINKDKTYYGMNIYRWERLMNPYRITQIVNRLSACQSDHEKEFILYIDLILKDLDFPAIYRVFTCIEDFYDDYLEDIDDIHDTEYEDYTNDKNTYCDYNRYIKYKISAMSKFLSYFYNFLNYTVYANRLILDLFIEKGCLGVEWKNLFLDMINQMTEQVFFHPDEIDYTIAPDSQENFRLYYDYYFRCSLNLTPFFHPTPSE